MSQKARLLERSQSMTLHNVSVLLNLFVLSSILNLSIGILKPSISQSDFMSFARRSMAFSDGNAESHLQSCLSLTRHILP